MKIPNIFSLLAFEGSRKVGFGLWLFFVSGAFLVLKIISSADWMVCMTISGTLVGGGTLMDTWLEKKKENAPAPVQ